MPRQRQQSKRLLSNVPAKKFLSADDLSLDYLKTIPFVKLSSYGIYITPDDELRDDDWNYDYNNPSDGIFWEDIQFLKDEVEKYRVNKPMPRLLSNKEPTKLNKEMPKTTFGNKPSEIDFVRRILFEFGVDNEKELEIDRIITQVKVDMFQDKMEKCWEMRLK